MNRKFVPNPFDDDLPAGMGGSNRRMGFVFVDEIEIGMLSRLIEQGVTHDMVGRLSLDDTLLTRDEIERM